MRHLNSWRALLFFALSMMVTHIEAQKYEAENAEYEGTQKTIDGNSCIELQNSSDFIKINIQTESKAKYNVYVGYATSNGTKPTYVAVNSISKEVELTDNGTTLDEVLAGEFTFKAGSNILEVTPNWTWSIIDYVRIEKTEDVSETGGTKISDVRGFKVNGSQLQDSCGNEFIMRGVNLAYTWYTSNAYDQLKAVASTGANTVRIVLSNGIAYGKAADSATDVAKIISACRSYNMVAVLEVHDATGSDNIEDLEQAANYFVGIANVLKGTENDVIINIANEWHNSSSAENWKNGYVSAIKIIRAAGLRHCIMCDAGGYGQSAATIHSYGSQVLESDSEHNTMFSIHMYGNAGNTNRVKSNIDGVINQDLALCIGEFGWYHSDGDVDEDLILSYCQEKNIGWLAWSWYGNGSPVQYLDVVSSPSSTLSPASYNNITIQSWDNSSSVVASCDWGTKIINALKAQSVKRSTNGCINSSSTYNTKSEQAWVFPSKITDSFTITENGNYSIEIYDAFGHLITEKEGIGTTQLTCNQWDNGLYFVRINTTDGTRMAKLIK